MSESFGHMLKGIPTRMQWSWMRGDEGRREEGKIGRGKEERKERKKEGRGSRWKETITWSGRKPDCKSGVRLSISDSSLL